MAVKFEGGGKALVAGPPKKDRFFAASLTLVGLSAFGNAAFRLSCCSIETGRYYIHGIYLVILPNIHGVPTHVQHGRLFCVGED